MAICDKYHAIVKDLADRASEEHGDIDDKIFQAIDEGLIYREDEAYIIANALENGIVSWGHDVEWDAVYDMLYSDILEEIRKIKGE